MLIKSWNNGLKPSTTETSLCSDNTEKERKKKSQTLAVVLTCQDLVIVFLKLNYLSLLNCQVNNEETKIHCFGPWETLLCYHPIIFYTPNQLILNFMVLFSGITESTNSFGANGKKKTNKKYTSQIVEWVSECIDWLTDWTICTWLIWYCKLVSMLMLAFSSECLQAGSKMQFSTPSWEKFNCHSTWSHIKYEKINHCKIIHNH